MSELPFYSVSDFYKNLFGQKVYKLSIDAGCTCPNRDGTKGTGGCIFCSQGGSGEFAIPKNQTVTISEQLEKAKIFVNSKLPKSKKPSEQKFIAYFQNFTNTYGNFEKLSAQFLEAVSSPQIVGIAIGTRPDSLSERMLNFLSDLSQKTFVQLEFGLQTSNEKTALFINRAYSLCEYDSAMKSVKSCAAKIHVVTHIIFGLPDETQEDMMNTVRHAIAQKTDGIKITCLHILKNTKLSEIYEKTPFKVLDKQEYFERIKNALKIIPKDVVIHRLTGDGAKNLLIEPKWTADKHRVWNDLIEELKSEKVL